MNEAERRPSFARIADWIEGRLETDAAARLAITVEADPELQASAAWLADFAALTRTLPVEDPPPLIQQRLRQHFDRWSTAQAVLEQPVPVSVADLVFDSRLDRPLAGVRGASEDDAFHLAFQSELADLVVDVRPRPDGLLDLSGQVLPAATEAAPVFEASIRGGGSPRRCVDGDVLGRFELRGVPAEAAELRVGNGELEVVAALRLSPIGP